MAATKFHFDGPKALPLEFARTLAGPGPRSKPHQDSRYTEKVVPLPIFDLTLIYPCWRVTMPFAR